MIVSQREQWPTERRVASTLVEVAGVAQRLDDALARLEAVEAAEVAGVVVHHAALVHDHHVRQVVALARSGSRWDRARA